MLNTKNMYFQLRWLLLLPILLLFAATPVEKSSWEFKREKNGIKVFWRDSADSDIKELKIEFEIESSLNSLVSILNDPEYYTDWIYGTLEARIVKEESPQVIYYYSKSDFPWPLSDRDLINKSTISQDPITGIVTSYSVGVNEIVPEKEDVVRITKFESVWEIKPLRKNLNRVSYQLKSDPGGNIPTWMINLAIDQGPISTMENLRALIQEPRFQGANVSYITEKY